MTQTEHPSKDVLRNYQHLLNTATARRKLEDMLARPIPEQENVAWLEDRITRCEERDQQQKNRPDGCWCFGLGSDDPSPSYYDAALEGEKSQIMHSKFCGCLEGRTLQKQCLDLFDATEKARSWSLSGIPPRFKNYRLDTSPLAASNPELIAALKAGGKSCLFWGDYGVGKTGLAVGLAWCQLQLDHFYRPLFRSVPDLLSSLRSTYGRPDGPTEQEMIDRYSLARLLILDDLGAEQIRNTGWVEDRLYQIVNKRHGEESLSFFTSNLSPAELGAKIGERIVWRVIEMCGEDNVVEVKGPNLRDTKHAKT